jgi:hypothetical protein
MNRWSIQAVDARTVRRRDFTELLTEDADGTSGSEPIVSPIEVEVILVSADLYEDVVFAKERSAVLVEELYFDGFTCSR